MRSFYDTKCFFRQARQSSSSSQMSVSSRRVVKQSMFESLAARMNGSHESSRRHRFYVHWLAWMGLCGALAVHVVDEALTDFLALYNPTVLSIRERYPFLPLTTFTFDTWLSLLFFAIVVLTAVSYFV